MNCPYASQVDDYIDNALDAGERAAFDRHLPACAGCTAAVADLKAIQATARVLERHAPPPEVWQRIAAGIAAAPPERARVLTPGRWRTRLSAMRWQPIAAAAAFAIVAATGFFAWRLVLPAAAPATAVETSAAPTQAADAELLASVDTRLQLAEAQYSETISGLDAIRQQESGALDPETAEVVEANLMVIDDAIGESRAALASAPTNSVAQESLFGALQSKVSLLQDTIALINEMRKGDPEGSARIVSGMNP
jgi:anti-sigma factor RsiW